MKDWLEKQPQRIQLANQGDAEAQYELGKHNCQTHQSPAEKIEGVMWYRKAADQGHVDALYGLGNCYMYGDGVVKDRVEAYAYWNIIADVVQYGRASRDHLARHTPEIVARGEQRTKELLKEYDSKWLSE